MGLRLARLDVCHLVCLVQIVIIIITILAHQHKLGQIYYYYYHDIPRWRVGRRREQLQRLTASDQDRHRPHLYIRHRNAMSCALEQLDTESAQFEKESFLTRFDSLLAAWRSG